MNIAGHRTQFGPRLRERARERLLEAEAVRVVVVHLPPRPSPDPELVIVWYPHRDAPSLRPWPSDLGATTDYLTSFTILIPT